MTKSDRSFAGSIPEVYDSFLVPLIFEEYADDLAKRAADLQPESVLETAAGSGVVTRALEKKLVDTARIIATDLNQPMLSRAASSQGTSSKVEWQAADAMALPFDDNSFDVIVCQFGVMFFPDRIKAYRETQRILKPGGTFIFNTWDDIESNEFADEVTKALAQVFPDDPPKFLARTPHGYNNKDQIAEELTAAGFADIEITTREAISHAASAKDPATAYCQGTPLRNEIEARNASRLEEATAHAALAIEKRFGATNIDGKIRGHIATARKEGGSK